MTHFRHWFRAVPFTLVSGTLCIAACSGSSDVTGETADGGTGLTDGGTMGTTGTGTPTTTGGSTTGGSVTSGSSTTVGTSTTTGTTTGGGGATSSTTTSDTTSTTGVADSTTGTGGAGTDSTTGTDSTSGADGTTGMGGAGTTDGGTTDGGATDGGTTDGGTTDGGTSGGDDLNSGENTMGWIGCSMGENTAAGYRRVGGTRMWGGFGNGGAVVQQWTDNNSAGWQRFDQQVAQYGEPVAVWIMICIFAQAGATAQEVNAMIDNARSHSAPGVTIYLTGQPLYEPGHTCTLAGANGPESTDQLAEEVASQHDDVIYPGSFLLLNGEVSGDSCHANTQGEDSLGEQAKAFWGQP